MRYQLMNNMEHTIQSVVRRSPAGRAGIRSGDVLRRINGQNIVDVFDYEYYASYDHLTLELVRDD